MGSDVRTLIERHHIFYEVAPYYVLLDERPAGRREVRKKVQAGFDLYLYASGDGRPLRLADGDEQLQAAIHDLRETARQIAPQPKDHSEIHVLPLENSVILDTHKKLQPEALLRIRITHSRGLGQPAGAAEEEALSEMRKKLRELGVREGRRLLPV